MPLDRRDTAGKSIGGSSRYKIAFRDKVKAQTPIADTIWVESYKKYNAMDAEEETTICKCAIFWRQEPLIGDPMAIVFIYKTDL